MVNGADVLSRLKGIDVSSWNYISEGRSIRHMGPMAEDFFKAFQLGTGNTSIGLQDLTGVSLAAIKELDQRTTNCGRRLPKSNNSATRLTSFVRPILKWSDDLQRWNS